MLVGSCSGGDTPSISAALKNALWIINSFARQIVEAPVVPQLFENSQFISDISDPPWPDQLLAVFPASLRRKEGSGVILSYNILHLPWQVACSCTGRGCNFD